MAKRPFTVADQVTLTRVTDQLFRFCQKRSRQHGGDIVVWSMITVLITVAKETEIFRDFVLECLVDAGAAIRGETPPHGLVADAPVRPHPPGSA